MSESETAGPGLVEDDSSETLEYWPLRQLLLAAIGLATGYGIYLILGDKYVPQPSTLQLTEMVALVVGAGLFGFTLERRLWWASLLFALVTAGVAGGIIWWNGSPEHWGGGDGWRLFALFFAIVIAAPLFQTARDEDALFFPYASVHDHTWSNIVLWFACWAFVLLVWVLSWLLSALFLLIDIHILRDLLEKTWFVSSLIGLSFGAALGLLREHDFVVRLLQRVVATVLAVLAPVLAAGLILFVLALPFTGLAPLWKQSSATVILLTCTAGALILANVVIGSTPQQERRFPVLRGGAIGLALVMLPLAVLAAVAIGLRISQHGFTPERLWALTFIVFATAFGLAYLVALIRGRLDWAEKVRPANLILAVAMCAIAILLATPLISFNAISTRDQVARLESGKLTVDTFDWRALAFDFGEPGRTALNKLKQSANASIRDRAIDVGKAETAWQVPEIDRSAEQRATIRANTRLLPAGSAFPAEILEWLRTNDACQYDGDRCTLALVNGGKEAVLLRDGCFKPPKPSPAPVAGKPVELQTGDTCSANERFMLESGKWRSSARDPSTPPGQGAVAGYRDGRIEIRPVMRRQVFVGGVPVDDSFE